MGSWRSHVLIEDWLGRMHLMVFDRNKALEKELDTIHHR